VGEGDIFQRPEKLDANPFPRLFMFDAQFFGGFDCPGALETNVFLMPSQEIEENYFAQTVAGRPVRHT
jgi:hypothetical protein